MPELEKSRSSRTKRDSSKSRDAESKASKPRKSSEVKPSKTSRSKSENKPVAEEKEPYTKPSPRTLRKSSSENAKIDLKSKPPNTTITKIKSSKTSSDGSSKTRSDGKAFSSSSKGVSKSTKASSRDGRQSMESTASSRLTSKSRDSTLSKAAPPTGTKEESKRRTSRDPESSSRSTSKTSSSDKTKDPRRSEGKSRSERSRDLKEDPVKLKPGRGERDRGSRATNGRRESKGDTRLSRVTAPLAVVEDESVEPPAVTVPETGEADLSMDTHESGIYVSSPRVMSREDSIEEEVEGSISSKFVEVGDAEEVDEMIAVIEEEPAAAELSEDSGINGNDGSPGHRGRPQQCTREEPVIVELADDQRPSTSKDALLVADNEEDPYGEDDFEDYESDFEADEDDDIEEKEDDGTVDVIEDEDDDSMVDDEGDGGALTTDDEEEAHRIEEGVIKAPQPQDDPATADILRNAILQSMRPDEPEDPSDPSRPKTSKSFVNFAKLKEKHVVNQTAQVNRGLTLLSMISLDTVSVDLLTMQPINYDAFISSFGLTNTKQASTQTNEDSLSQETQTDVIGTLSKWTQRPISVNVSNLTQPPTPQDYLGVGGETVEFSNEIDSFASSASSNVGRLTKFLGAASQVVLSLLEEESVYLSSSSYEGGSLGHGRGGGGFSNHGVLFGGNASDKTHSFGAFLATSAVTCILFSSSDSSVVATGHGFGSEIIGTKDTETDYGMSEQSHSGLVLVWSVHEPSQPKHILRCNSTPKALAFSPGRPLLVMAGLSDSTLAVWDLKEPAHLHPNMTLDEDMNLVHVQVSESDGNELRRPSDVAKSQLTWRCRVPSFITACSESERATLRNRDPEEPPSSPAGTKNAPGKSRKPKATDSASATTSGTEDGFMSSPIICLQTVDVQYESQQTVESNAFQVVSLSACGELVWWVVFQTRDRMAFTDEGEVVAVSAHMGASPWSKIMVNQAFRYSVLSSVSADLYSRLGCTDCKLSASDANTLYVSTTSGAVRHINRLHQRTQPQAFLAEMEPTCSSTCVCVCPHLPSYLLVGCSDGTVRLHSLTSSRPLTTWPSPDVVNPQPVVNITWSYERPCVFYVHELQRVHVWDLSAGDMTPVATLDTEVVLGEQGPMVFSLAPSRLFNRPVVNAMFGSRSGRLILRQLENEFLNETPDKKAIELERFEFYATII
ncbi:cytoplasmic dynein 2 intermediate chain 1 isoform X2 [Hyalella azteca]|uniref:Cytoplasmic dynein 2 intermediate chain 1 isoform X2 n=1 Tax=Hyalella azteca TaxID=294128 RepID=A0A979FVW4_HYAAZ|nr:cytoplasmic dynein 2 intermediate chain 1 isoform X2 [Hyalella azteca]